MRLALEPISKPFVFLEAEYLFYRKGWTEFGNRAKSIEGIGDDARMWYITNKDDTDSNKKYGVVYYDGGKFSAVSLLPTPAIKAIEKSVKQKHERRQSTNVEQSSS